MYGLRPSGVQLCTLRSCKAAVAAGGETNGRENCVKIRRRGRRQLAVVTPRTATVLLHY